MSTLHSTFANPSTTGQLTVALAGNPNSGKTTLFNALTGLRQKVANYPGVTVEKKTGRCKLPTGQVANIIDLPGTYSLISRSPDEVVAMQVLRGLRADTPAPDLVVVVIDASNLQRNLYLVSQLIELGRPMVVALNMTDVAERRGLRVDAAALQRELGVPVIPIVGHKRKGIAELKTAIASAAVAPLPDWQLPEVMREELLLVGGGLAILDSDEASGFHVSTASPDLAKSGKSPPELGTSAIPRSWICRGDDSARHIDRYQAVAERLLIGDRAEDIAAIATREPIASLLTSATNRLLAVGIDPMHADIEAHYRWIEKVVHAASSAARITESQTPGNVLAYAAPVRRPLSERIDRILIHKFWGLIIFALIMGTLFVTLFWLARPIMDAIDAGVKSLAVLTTAHMTEGPLRALLKDGIFGGVGVVVVFVPQIALLFLFLAILEDSGYLARAAFLMDRLLAKVGLHGKSFIPLLSSFACAIPGIMATRTIESRKDRLATIFVAPFMSCSARLPVYTLLIGAIFATSASITKAGIMLALYTLGIAAAAGTAWIFKRSLLKGGPSSFILEMPTYKLPQLSQIARQVSTNTKAFITKAGTTIFFLSVILWAMSYYPRLPEARAQSISKTVHNQMEMSGAPVGIPTDNGIWYRTFSRPATMQEMDNAANKAIAAAQSEHSIAGHLGHAMEPFIRPLGYDWKMGVGLVGAFAAREVFVSTLGIIYSVGEVEDGKTADLATAMKADRYTSGPRAGQTVWTPLSALSLLVWFVLAMQCMSTFAIVRRETASWRWPIFMLLYMNALAYVVSLGVYQIGRIWWT